MKINKKPKFTIKKVVVPRISIRKIKTTPLLVEKQKGLDCALYSLLNLINNSSFVSTDIDTIRKNSEFAKNDRGYYREAGI